jgi:hypothetical protein
MGLCNKERWAVIGDLIRQALNFNFDLHAHSARLELAEDLDIALEEFSELAKVRRTDRRKSLGPRRERSVCGVNLYTRLEYIKKSSDSSQMEQARTARSTSAGCAADTFAANFSVAGLVTSNVSPPIEGTYSLLMKWRVSMSDMVASGHRPQKVAPNGEVRCVRAESGDVSNAGSQDVP